MTATAAAPERNQSQEIIRAIEAPNLKAQVMRALPKHLELDRFMRICLTVVNRTPSLRKCETLSVIGSIMEASQLGLELDPVLGHGYLIPRKSKKLSEQYNRPVTLCTFMPGYRGFIQLMRNSGLVTNVNAELVLKDEEFRVNLGTQRALIHVPNYEDPNRGVEKHWRGAYTTVLFSDGSQPDFEFLPASEINERRNRSEAKDSGPWVTDTEAMWKKTSTRAIAKRMPLSPQNRKLEMLVRTAILDENRENEEYREREPVAPALELPPEQEVIEVSDEREQPESEQGKKDRERIRRKSEKAQPPEGGNPAVPKAQMPPKENSEPPELASTGSVRNLMKFALEERGLSREEFINILGSHGYEKPEEIAKKDYAKVWEDIGNARPAKK